MRIISLAPSNTEILFALGLDKEIVGVTRFCDYPAEARKKTVLGGWLDIDYGKVKELKPDLILTSTFVQDKVTERLKQMKLPVFAVYPRTLNGILESIFEIGILVKKERAAEGLVKQLMERINSVKQKTGKKRPRVYVEEWHRPPTVSGNWVPEMLEIAGGFSDLIKAGEYSREVKTEQIREFDPEIIILSWCGFGIKVPLSLVKNRQGWEKINAVKSENVFVFDDTFLNRPGPRIIEGLEMLWNIINSGETI